MAMPQDEIEYRIKELEKQITAINSALRKITPMMTTKMLSLVTEQELIDLRNKLNQAIIDIQNLQSQI